MRTNLGKPEEKPFKQEATATRILAIDPGRSFACAAWNSNLNQIVFIQGQTHPSSAKITLRLREVLDKVEMAWRTVDQMNYTHIVACEYPIPFYRASRESIAATNMHAGIWLGMSPDIADVQMYAPGNVKDLPVWNNKGKGLERAQKFLLSFPPKPIDADIDNVISTDITELARDYKYILDTKKVKPSKDAASALGILFRAIEYNGLKMVDAPRTFIIQL
jgi:hypothetical protein